MNKSCVKTLKTFIAEIYGINVNEISPAKRGFFGETWNINSQRADYFVKIDYWDYHKEIYRNSFQAMDYIAKSGIDYIPQIIPTIEGKLCADFNAGVMGIFEYIEGENTEDYPIGRLFERLAPIYKLNGTSLALERETFNTAVMDKYDRLRNRLYPLDTNAAKRIITVLEENTELFEKYGERLKIFSSRCMCDFGNFCITHGDAGGNCILNGDDFTIIDWDYPKIAPIERDAWVFMWDKKQTDSINSALKHGGIDYFLNFDRFCYYCYHSFFYYLTEYLMAYLCVSSDEEQAKIADGVESYFSSWIFMQLAAADKLS